jgi:hypothetical protein
MLSISVVSAMSVHDDDQQHHELAVHEHSDSELNLTSDLECDHHCHITSHFLGLVSLESRLFQPQVDSLTVHFEQSLVSFISAPPFQPPKT